MKICIVGEGPVGLLTALLFIYYKKKYSITDLELFLYRSRLTFERRHIINITKDIMKNIEKLIDDCDSCLLKELSQENIEKINMSINCLETNLYYNINTESITVYQKKFTSDEQFAHNFNNIFLCDGYQSLNRETIIYDNKKIVPVKCVLTDTIVIVLYTNLPELTIVNKDTCITDNSTKTMFNSEYIESHGISFEYLIALISIVYSVNFRYEMLPIIDNIDLTQKNIWSDGFLNFDDFITIFSKTIKYINNTDSKSIIAVFKDTKTYVSENMLFLLSDKKELGQIFEKFNVFLDSELTRNNGNTKPFMIHSVTPNCTSHGMILDETTDTLLFARKLSENVYAWLLGDSANSYPPGYSLLIGLKDSFFLVQNFLKINFPNEYEFFSNLSEERNLFMCNESTGKYTDNFLSNPITCDYLKGIDFEGGYVKDNPNNEMKIKLHKLIEIIQTKNCHLLPTSTINNDYLVDYYNFYQLNNFFYNMSEILCKISLGGNKIKKEKQKRKNKKGKKKNIKKKKSKNKKVKTKKRQINKCKTINMKTKKKQNKKGKNLFNT